MMKLNRILIYAVMIFSIVIACSACTSKEAKNTIALIDNIGEVSVNSKDAIDAAEEAYSQLSAEDKDSVSNIDTLRAAQKEYEKYIPEYIEDFLEPYQSSSFEKVSSFNKSELKRFVAEYYDRLTDEQIEMIGCAIVREQAEGLLSQYVKSSLKNPDSFQFDSLDLSYISKNSQTGEYSSIISMTFRGTNSFGAIVPDSVNGTVYFDVDIKSCTASIADTLFL